MKQKLLEFLETKHYQKFNQVRIVLEIGEEKERLEQRLEQGLNGEGHPWSPQCDKGWVAAWKSIRV